jgi:hypothetical protein
MNKYLDELEAMTAAREAFNARTRELHAARGIPSTMPLVATPDDAEMMEYLAEGTALLAREKAFDEKYGKPGIDPHTVDD